MGLRRAELALASTVGRPMFFHPSVTGGGGLLPPAAPTGLTAAFYPTGNTLSWSSVTGATSYNLYRGTSSGGEAKIVTGATSPYNDTSGTLGTKYYYTVTAVGFGGESLQSSEVNITSVAGLQLWLKADAGAYHDAGTTLATNGQTVQQWNDQSGNTHNLSQSTGADRPTFTTNVQNGLPVLRFDGSATFMQASFTLVLPTTTFVAGNLRSVPSTSIWLDGFVDGRMMQGDNPAFADFAMNNLLGASMSTGVFYTFYSLLTSSSSAEVSLNGGTKTSGSPAIGGNPNGITVGSRGAGTSPAAFDMGEVLVYNSALSAGDYASVLAYLRTRWANY